MAYSVIIFCASSVPNVAIPLSGLNFDALLHILVYIPFGLLMARAVYNTKNPGSRTKLLGIVLAATLIYGASDEIHQYFVPGRNASWTDWLADTLGGLIGGYVYLWRIKATKQDR